MLVWLTFISWVIHSVGSQSYSSRPRPYHFEYEVADDKSGDYHGHRETQNHDGSVTGSYFLLSPDGLWRETQYSDQGYGFKAVTNTFPTNSPPKHRTGSTYSVFQTSGSDFETLSNDLIGRPVAGGSFDSTFKNANVPPFPVVGQDAIAPAGGNKFFSTQNGGSPPPILGQNVNIGFTEAQQNVDFPGSPSFPLKSDGPPSLLGQDVNVGVGLPDPQVPLTGSSGSPQLPLQPGPDFLVNQGFGVKLPSPGIPPVDGPTLPFLQSSGGSLKKGHTKFNEVEQISAGPGLGGSDPNLFPQFSTGGEKPQAPLPGLPLSPSNFGTPGSQTVLPGAIGDVSAPGLLPQSFGAGRPLSNQQAFNTRDPHGSVNVKNGSPAGQFFNSENFGSVGRPLSATSSQLPLSSGTPQNPFFTGSPPEEHLGQQFESQGILNENDKFGPSNQGFPQNVPPSENLIHPTSNPGLGLAATDSQRPLNENVNNAPFFGGPPSGIRQPSPPFNGGEFGPDGNPGGTFGPLNPSGFPESAANPNSNAGFGLGSTGNFGTNEGGNFGPDFGPPGSFEPGTGFRGDLRPDPLQGVGFDPNAGPAGNFGPGIGPDTNFGPETGVRGNNFTPGLGGGLNRPDFDSGANFSPGISADEDFRSGPPQIGNNRFGPNLSEDFGGPLQGSVIDPGTGPGSEFNPGNDFTAGSGPDGNLGSLPFPTRDSGPLSGPRGSFRPNAGAGGNFKNNVGGNSNFGNGFGGDLGFGQDTVGGGLNSNLNNANIIHSAPERFRVQSEFPSQGGIALDDPRVGPQLPLRSQSSQNFRITPPRKRSPSKGKVTRGIGVKLNSDALKDLNNNPRNLPQGSVSILKNLQKSQRGSTRTSLFERSKNQRSNKVPKVKARDVKAVSEVKNNFSKGFSNFN